VIPVIIATLPFAGTWATSTDVLSANFARFACDVLGDDDITMAYTVGRQTVLIADRELGAANIYNK
jgi:hypothetical protein